MSLKKGIGSLLGFTAVVGAVALAVKYLVDYTDFKEKASEDFHDIEGDSGEVKEAAKRTYTSLNMKDRSELKEAAKDLAGAAGKVAVDAGSITVTAGKSAADHVKDTYSKYKEDPDSTKAEVMGNFKGLAKDVSSKVSSVSRNVIDSIKTSEASDRISDLKDSVSDKIGALGDTITGFKDEYKKNLEEIEAESARKKGEIAEKLSAGLNEEAEKHSHIVSDDETEAEIPEECLYSAEASFDETGDEEAAGSSENETAEGPSKENTADPDGQ